jgi:outer membrane protein OmpA-like peptidoglycan-associated protein
MKPVVTFLILTLVLGTSLPAQAQSSVEKLPPTVNSDISEVAPVISADGQTLYFVRPRQALDSSIVVDIWRSQLDSNGKWGVAEVLGGALASHFGIAVASIAPDNNTLYLMGKLEESTLPEDRLYVSHKLKDGWSQPQSIHIENLHPKGEYTDYSFGPDQRTLIMSVDRDSSMGGRDLYVSFFDEKTNSWSQPVWLGSDINSIYNEVTPFLAADNRTLYFSSDRPGGYGAVDVYRSIRLDDTWKKWSLPENMGPKINQNGRTLYYTEDAKGEYAYFVWRPSISGQTDIYRALVPKQKASVVALVKGHVRDQDGRPIAAHVRYQRLSDGKELGIARSDPNSGAYQITLPGGENYGIRAEKKGFIPTSEHLDLSTLKEFKTVESELVLTAIKQGAVVRLNSIFFETDKAALLPASFPELDRLKGLLLQDSVLRISIEGHTDSIGSAEHNLALSKDRATAVKSYLVKAGIPASRLEVQAFGSTKPIATNSSEDGRSQNRRVQFTILASSAITTTTSDE